MVIRRLRRFKSGEPTWLSRCWILRLTVDFGSPSVRAALVMLCAFTTSKKTRSAFRSIFIATLRAKPAIVPKLEQALGRVRTMGAPAALLKSATRRSGRAFVIALGFGPMREVEACRSAGEAGLLSTHCGWELGEQ